MSLPEPPSMIFNLQRGAKQISRTSPRTISKANASNSKGISKGDNGIGETNNPAIPDDSKATRKAGAPGIVPD